MPNLSLKALLPGALLALALAACSGEGAGAPDAGATEAAEIGEFPAVLEGEFSVDVAEGDVDEEGISDFNFGTLVVDGRQLPVEVDGAVLRRISVTGDSPVRVRATLGSSSDEFGVVVYRITALEKL
jgi:hypothetical protein